MKNIVAAIIVAVAASSAAAGVAEDYCMKGAKIAYNIKMAHQHGLPKEEMLAVFPQSPSGNTAQDMMAGGMRLTVHGAYDGMTVYAKEADKKLVSNLFAAYFYEGCLKGLQLQNGK